MERDVHGVRVEEALGEQRGDVRDNVLCFLVADGGDDAAMERDVHGVRVEEAHLDAFRDEFEEPRLLILAKEGQGWLTNRQL